MTQVPERAREMLEAIACLDPEDERDAELLGRYRADLYREHGPMLEGAFSEREDAHPGELAWIRAHERRAA